MATHSPRDKYQDKRLASLKRHINLHNSTGLEIGACHKPTVPAMEGRCKFADFRSADTMAEMWNLKREEVCDVSFILDRTRRVSDQIHRRFDYIIACHVVEHLPDPIGYIKDLGEMLRPGGVIMLTLPDKRFTFDSKRPLSKLDQMLMHYHERTIYPSIEHVMEFHRYALEHGSGNSVPIAEAFSYAVESHASGDADAHCNVWEDTTFQEQFQTIGDAGFLGDLRLVDFEPTPEDFIEFTVFFKAE